MYVSDNGNAIVDIVEMKNQIIQIAGNYHRNLWRNINKQRFLNQLQRDEILGNS